MNKPVRRKATKWRDPGIMVVMEDGPCKCLVPIPRGDLRANTPSFQLPYMWDSITYRLVQVDQDRVHHYQWEPS